MNGRQFIVFPVAAGQGLFPIRFGGAGPAGAVSGAPEAAAAGQGRGGRGGRGGGAPQPSGAYIAYALPPK